MWRAVNNQSRIAPKEAAMTVDVFSAKRLEGQVRVEPKSTGIVVIDMLNEFCKPGGAMVLPGYERLVAPQKTVIDAGRAAGSPVLFVADTHRKNVRQDREFLKRTSHCLEGSWGAQVIDELEPRPDDLYIVKRRYSAFFNTDLDLTLRDLRVDTLVIVGVVTNICVRSTVHDAFFLGYQVVVPEDCVAATGPREQESSLYDIGTHFGIVADSGQVAAALLRSAPLENRIAA
jgi:ureidoacrylate peracid hydrolase